MRTLAATPLEPPAMPDAALPGLDRALDATALGTELAACWSAADGAPPAPESGRLFYVRYKPETSLLVGFRYRRQGAEPPPAGPEDRLTLDDEGVPTGELIGYARLLPARRFAEAEASSRAVALKRRGARLFVRPAAGLLFHLFPYDRALVGLRTVARRGPLKRWAAAHLAWPEAGGRVRGSSSTLDLLRYKPERRAVFAADLSWENAGRDRLERHEVLLKSYAPGEGSRSWAVMCRLTEAAPGDVALAAPLGWREEDRLLVQSRVAGTPLFPALSDPIRATALAGAVGQALRRIQMVRPPDTFRPPRPGAAWSDETLAETAGLPALLERLGAGAAAGTARRLHETLVRIRPAAAAATLIHGDFYHHQILVDAGRIGIVDFDEARCDDPRIDVGTFLAHLDLEALRGDSPALPGDTLESAAAAFLAGYATAGGALDGLDWFRAAGLARLAVVPFRNLRPGWRVQANALLRRSLEVLT